MKAKDTDIVRRVLDGNLDSYAELVNAYSKPLKRYVRRFVYTEEASEDVVQEAFIKAYINLRSFKLDKKFSSWLYRIAHNEAITYIRKHKNELNPDDESYFNSIVDDKKSLEEMMDEKLDSQNLVGALNSIKTKYKEPIVLHFLEGKSYEDISEILHIPTSTVGTRIRRAKEQLKKDLERRRK